jgi:hypothetical protein
MTTHPGNQDPGNAPTPAEIAERCAEIQGGWSAAAERHRRTGSSVEKPFSLPSVSTAALGHQWPEEGAEPLKLLLDEIPQPDPKG